MIDVVPYDASWVDAYEKEAAILRALLGLSVIEIHHFGSTSIPGLLAKPKIDMILVVDDLKASLKLLGHGYRCGGEINIPLRLFFAKRVEGVKINLHVVEPGHAFIGINLAFRDYLRLHPKECQAYSQLKEELLKDPEANIRKRGRIYGYTLGKDAFIKNILEKAGFDAYALNIPLHDAEWKAFHELTGNEEIEPAFILYKGTKIVGAASDQIVVKDEQHRAPFEELLEHYHQRKELRNLRASA